MIEELDLSMFNDEDDIIKDLIEEKIEPKVDDNEPPAKKIIDGEEPPADPDIVDDDILKEGETGAEGEENDDTKGVKLVYSNIAKLLKEEGLFNEEVDLEKVESSDALVEALKGEIKRNEFSDLSKTQKEYLDAIRKGIPENLFLQHQETVNKYSQISDEMVGDDEELRKNLILGDLISKGVGEGRATKLYKTFLDAGEDIDEALSSLKSLKDAETAEYQAKVDAQLALVDQAKKDEKSLSTKIKNSVYDVTEIIKDYKITDKLRDSVYNNMTKAVTMNKDGVPINKFNSDREKAPIEFDTKLYYLYTMTKGFKDFSIFEKKAQSKAARELERAVNESNMLNVGSTPTVVSTADETDVPQIIELS